jgi:malate dehydrogenase (oxaloacetate-decarboxylating)(NADP+)
VLGPYILGLEHPVQIAPMTASASDLMMLAVLAAGDAHARQQREAARSAPRSRLKASPIR